MNKNETKQERVELSVHTKMSKMDGVTHCEAYIKRAIEYGMNSLAITDMRSSACISKSTKVFRKFI